MLELDLRRCSFLLVDSEEGLFNEVEAVGKETGGEHLHRIVVIHRHVIIKLTGISDYNFSFG